MENVSMGRNTIVNVNERGGKGMHNGSENLLFLELFKASTIIRRLPSNRQL